MINEQFKEQIESGIGGVVIMAGSGSDDEIKSGQKKSHIEKLADGFEKYAIPYIVRIASAHKQGGKVEDVVEPSYTPVEIAAVEDASFLAK